MIKPTIGRVVWVFNRDGRIPDSGSEPEVALVCHVWSDTCINVAGFDHNGEPFKVTSLIINVPDNPHVHAEWMPYQIGQAAKHEAEKGAAV